MLEKDANRRPPLEFILSCSLRILVFHFISFSPIINQTTDKNTQNDFHKTEMLYLERNTVYNEEENSLLEAEIVIRDEKISLLEREIANIKNAAFLRDCDENLRRTAERVARYENHFISHLLPLLLLLFSLLSFSFSPTPTPSLCPPLIILATGKLIHQTACK